MKRQIRTALALAVAQATLSLAGTHATAAEALTPLERARLQVMLRDVQGAITSTYFDPTFKGRDLTALAATARQRIAAAATPDAALAAIAQFTMELDDSHTFFSPPRLNVAVDYGWEMRMVGDQCFVYEVKAGSDAQHQGVMPGDLVISVNGFQPTRHTLWKIQYIFEGLRPQPGLHVELRSPTGAQRELDLAAAVHPLKQVLDLSLNGSGTDWGRYEWEADRDSDRWRIREIEVGADVYVLRLPVFHADEDQIRQIVRRAHARAGLIIDVRGNPGGYPAVLAALVSELSSDPVKLYTMVGRDTKTDYVAKGSGRSAYQGRIFVLTDAASSSAAELLARTIQLADRGTVIGDRTSGSVMVGAHERHDVNGGDNVIVYSTSVTKYDIVMPDGGRLENAGVEPDFKVLPTAEDLQAGRDPALAQALKFLGHDIGPAAAGALINAATTGGASGAH